MTSGEPPAPAPAILVRDLHVSRGGARILHGIDLAVPAGTILGLLGPSGCGKTTLMRTVVGVQRIASGSVDVLGHPAGDRAMRGRIGYVTQENATYSDITVRDNPYNTYYTEHHIAPPLPTEEGATILASDDCRRPRILLTLEAGQWVSGLGLRWNVEQFRAWCPVTLGETVVMP